MLITDAYSGSYLRPVDAANPDGPQVLAYFIEAIDLDVEQSVVIELGTAERARGALAALTDAIAQAERLLWSDADRKRGGVL